MFCLLDHKWAVHEKQRLLRNRGRKPLGARSVRAGEVEGAKESGEILALDESIDRSARAERLSGQIVGASARGEVELAGNRQQHVAQRLEIEAAPIHAPEPLVAWIDLGGLGIVVAALLIGAG